MNIHLNIGDLYALMAAVCWSAGVILFEISGKTLSSIQMNFLKNIIGIIGFIIFLFITDNLIETYEVYEYKLLLISDFFNLSINFCMKPKKCINLLNFPLYLSEIDIASISFIKIFLGTNQYTYAISF